MRLSWGNPGSRKFEAGVDRGVLYIPDAGGVYSDGVPWNGLTSVTEAPSGAEASPQYADNKKYLNLVSSEEYNATIEALTVPDEFDQFDGKASPIKGLTFGQQGRGVFGFCYRTLLGNDLVGTDLGFSLHLAYGLLAAPSEKAYATIGENVEPVPLSYELSSTPVDVGVVNGQEYKPTASVTIKSTDYSAELMNDLMDVLYGTDGVDPRLPLPSEVYTILSGAVTTSSMPVAPAYNASTDTVTIPVTTGVDYYVNGEVVTGSFVITQDTLVQARPKAGFKLPEPADDEFLVDFS